MKLIMYDHDQSKDWEARFKSAVEQSHMIIYIYKSGNCIKRLLRSHRSKADAREEVSGKEIECFFLWYYAYVLAAC